MGQHSTGGHNINFPFSDAAGTARSAGLIDPAPSRLGARPGEGMRAALPGGAADRGTGVLLPSGESKHSLI
jgi:hypothetical protein